jgi:hypothetical protein
MQSNQALNSGTQQNTPSNALNLTLPPRNNLPSQHQQANITQPNSFGTPGLLTAVNGGNGGNGINTL